MTGIVYNSTADPLKIEEKNYPDSTQHFPSSKRGYDQSLDKSFLPVSDFEAHIMNNNLLDVMFSPQGLISIYVQTLI